MYFSVAWIRCQIGEYIFFICLCYSAMLAAWLKGWQTLSISWSTTLVPTEISLETFMVPREWSLMTFLLAPPNGWHGWNGVTYCILNGLPDVHVPHRTNLLIPFTLKFYLVPSSGQNSVFSYFNTFIYDQMPAKLMIFTSVSAVLCVLCWQGWWVWWNIC